MDTDMYTGLSKYSTAKGSGTGFSLVGPAKVKARKSVLFTESSLVVWNKEHLVDFVVTLCFTSLCFNALSCSKVSQSTLGLCLYMRLRKTGHLKVYSVQ